MNSSKFVKAQTSTTPSALAGDDLSIILFLSDVSTASNWDGKTVKSYSNPDEIALDFPENHWARTVAAKVFGQVPSVSTLKIGRRNLAQTMTGALDAAEAADSKWFLLVGARGEDIFEAGDWIEARVLKFGIYASEDPFSLDAQVTTSIKARFALKGYKKSCLLWHHQSGTKLTGVKITVAAGVATATAASVAQVAKVAVDTVLDSTNYTLTFNGQAVTSNSGVGATFTTIRDGLINVFNQLPGAIGLAEVGVGANELKITAIDPGTPFTLAAVANMTVTETTANQTAEHLRRVGDQVVIEGSSAAFNGLRTVKEVILQSNGKSDQFTFDAPLAVANDVSGNASIDGGFTYPDAAAAGMGLAFPMGKIDWAFKSLGGIEPSPETLITESVSQALELANCNYYTAVGGRNILFEAVTGFGIPIDQMIGLGLWLPNLIKGDVYAHITGQKRFTLDDSGLLAVKVLVEQCLARAQAAGLTAPFVEDFALYPDTGLPAGAQLGDHYVVKVPQLKDVPKIEREAGKVLSGIEYQIQGAKGFHFVNIFGNFT